MSIASKIIRKRKFDLNVNDLFVEKEKNFVKNSNSTQTMWNYDTFCKRLMIKVSQINIKFHFLEMENSIKPMIVHLLQR
jgi:hypothetical protein